MDKRTIALVIVVIILVASLGAYYLNTSSLLARRDATISSLQSQINSLRSIPPSTTTVTMVSTVTITLIPATPTGSKWTNISSSGLGLLVDLNATKIATHGAIAAKIALFNVLDENISLEYQKPASSTAISKWDGYDFVCGTNPIGDAAGYALFRGHFTSANISAAAGPLSLAPPIEPPCATWVGPSKLVLPPHGSSAMNVTTKSCANLPTGATLCGVGTGLYGYWDSGGVVLKLNDATTSSSYFHYFPAGEYTLVVEDMWNQTVYAYFEVSSLSGSLSSQSGSS